MEAVLMGRAGGGGGPGGPGSRKAGGTGLGGPGEPEGRRHRAANAPYSPCRSKGGVYSSLALLFSCMKPSVRPRAMASSTTWLYS